MAKNYSELKNKLNQIIDRIQSPDIELDEAIKLHKEGEAIIKELEVYLAQASQKIKSVKKRR